MKNLLFIFFTLLLASNTYNQESYRFLKKSDTLNSKRKNTVIISETVLAGGTLLALNQLWYANKPRSKFHFINDNNNWNQMDKIGHAFTSYYLGKKGMEVLDWSGVSNKNQIVFGATLGFSFLTGIEILDGFSKEWGASWGDIIANGTGTGLLIGQELLWQEQRIIFKYSFNQTKYANQRPNTLGKNLLEQIIKDYNGQTYWLSTNLWSFKKNSKIPKWLNLAFGYGSNGMIYAKNNSNSYRQYYLSLDLDLSKIETKSNLLKTVFSVVNFIKIPSPTLELNSKNKFKFHYIYF